MSLHKQPELKDAVLNLPQNEKDKLLVRLVSKDKMLMKQLHFQLLENKDDLEDRIEGLKESIHDLFSANRHSIKNIPQYSNYRELQALLRQGSGMINEHEKVTKDKYSEMECRIFLLKQAFEQFPRLFEASAVHAAFKLQLYVKARLKTTAGKFDKLHEDLQFDLSHDMQQVLDFAQTYHLM